MLDDDAKKILNLPFPQRPQVVPRVYKEGKHPKDYTPGRVMGQKQLAALKAGAVPKGKTLNPYGSCGYTFRGKYRATFFKKELKPAWREAAMKRKRLKLQEKKAIQLEAHELQQLARENATAAFETLIEISKNVRAPEATRIAASVVILDRGYGKASQTNITANVTDGKTSNIDSTELVKRIDNALKRAEELTNRAPKTGKSPDRPADVRLNHKHSKWTN